MAREVEYLPVPINDNPNDNRLKLRIASETERDMSVTVPVPEHLNDVATVSGWQITAVSPDGTSYTFPATGE